MSPNGAQRESWDGPGGDFWAAHADRFDQGVRYYHRDLLEAAALRPGERVLDVGCGNGLLTIDATRRSGSALGVDLSGPMLAVARERAAARGGDGATFLQADAQTHRFPSGGFDVVLSRHGTMFFDDPVAAFANLAGALRPGGRLAQVVWQPLDVQDWLPCFAEALRFTPPGPDGPGPFSLGDPDTVRRVLTDAGFDDVDVVGIRHMMWFGETAEDATSYVADQFGGALEALEPAERAEARAELHVQMALHESDYGVWFGSACWLVTARRP